MEFDGTEYNKEHFTPEKLCSWCLKEKGIPPTKGDSHGICKRHYNQIMKEIEEEEHGKDD